MGTLALFMRDFHDHKRVPEVQLAMAELAYRSGKPDDAKSILIKISNGDAPQEVKDRAYYLALHRADRDAGGTGCRDQDGGRVAAANPDPALVPEIRLKLGRFIISVKTSPARARVRARRLREQGPGITGEGLLPCVANASMKSMNTEAAETALKLFDRVVQMGGQFRGGRAAQAGGTARAQAARRRPSCCTADLATAEPHPSTSSAQRRARRGEAYLFRGGEGRQAVCGCAGQV